MENFEKKVKTIVKNNFNISCDIYHEFEKKYKFFYNLTCELAKFINVKKDSTLLDAGCGCGYSMKAIWDNFTKNVYGVDISDKMIELGKKLYPELNFFLGDVAELDKIFKKDFFDYVLFNLVVFVLPDLDKTFNATKNILKKGGIIAFSYYPDIIDNSGNDLISLAFKRASLPEPKKRVISEYEKCIKTLLDVGFTDIKQKKYEMDLKIGFIKDFFSIPAQSASLFPKDKYEIRKEKVNILFDKIKDFENKGKIIWKFAFGIK